VVDGGSGGDEQVDEAALGGRVPGGGQRAGVAGVVQRGGAAAVDGVDRGAGGEQGAGGVVAQAGGGQVQGGVAPVELVGQLRDEEVLVHALGGRGRRDPGRVVRQDRLDDGLHEPIMSCSAGPGNQAAMAALGETADDAPRGLDRSGRYPERG
jgi:hypothetical protein